MDLHWNHGTHGMPGMDWWLMLPHDVHCFLHASPGKNELLMPVFPRAKGAQVAKIFRQTHRAASLFPSISWAECPEYLESTDWTRKYPAGHSVAVTSVCAQIFVESDRGPQEILNLCNVMQCYECCGEQNDYSIIDSIFKHQDQHVQTCSFQWYLSGQHVLRCQ